ncbi:hypothetical protein ACFYOT_41695 [Saccharothrix saharensis]|uniref:hypothetical protein n=1 Tax=Saccharothrix saharensis TaxID=571190 RepID=UPI0036C8D13E
MALHFDDVPPSPFQLFAAWLVPAWLIPKALNRDRHRNHARRDRKAASVVQAVMDHPGQPPRFALYLRSFATTGRLSAQPPEAEKDAPYLDAEKIIGSALRDLPLVAVGRPGEVDGAGRVPVAEDRWQSVVEQLVDAAELIVLVPSAAPGTLWEMKLLRERGRLDRTVFLMPEQVSERKPPDGYHDFGWPSRAAGWDHAEDRHGDHDHDWDQAVDAAAQIGLTLPPYRYEGALFTLDADGKPTRIRSLALMRLGRRVDAVEKFLADLRSPGEPGTPLPPGPVEFRRQARIRPHKQFVGPMAGCLAPFVLVSTLAWSTWWLLLISAAGLLVLSAWLRRTFGQGKIDVTLTVDDEGLEVTDYLTGTSRYAGWGELDAVEIQSTPSERMLTVVANGRCFPVAGLFELGIDEERLIAALRRFSEGRYRESLVRSDAPARAIGGRRYYPVSPDPVIDESPVTWRVTRKWIRERLIFRIGHAAVWLSVAAALFWVSHWVHAHTSGGWQLLSLPPGMIGFTCLTTRAVTALRGSGMLIDDAGITYRPAKPANPTVFMPWSKIESIDIVREILPSLEIFMRAGYRLPPTGRPGVFFRRSAYEFVITRHGVPVHWGSQVSFQRVIVTFPLKRMATALETHLPH